MSLHAGDAHANPRPAAFPSVREFLAQEFMHALGVPTSRSLTLLASRSEQALQELQTPFSHPCDAQFPELAAVYGRANPRKLFPLGGCRSTAAPLALSAGGPLALIHPACAGERWQLLLSC